MTYLHSICAFSLLVFSLSLFSQPAQAQERMSKQFHFNESGSRFAHQKILSIDAKNMVMQNAVIQAAKLPMDTDNSQAFYKAKDNGTCTTSSEFQFRAKPAFMNQFDAWLIAKATGKSYGLNISREALRFARFAEREKKQLKT